MQASQHLSLANTCEVSVAGLGVGIILSFSKQVRGQEAICTAFCASTGTS